MIEVPTLSDYNQRLRDATEKSVQLKKQLNQALSLIAKLRKRSNQMKSELKKHGLYKGEPKAIAMQMIVEDYTTDAIIRETGFGREYIYKLRSRIKKAAVG